MKTNKLKEILNIKGVTGLIKIALIVFLVLFLCALFIPVSPLFFLYAIYDRKKTHIERMKPKQQIKRKKVNDWAN